MSAALQTATQQHTALASSPLASPSSRQYRPQHSSPSREAYNAQQNSTASPSSRRPPSRKTTENAPSPAYHLTPGFGNQAVDTVASPEQPSHSSDRLTTMPPVAPPRTSSNHQSSSSRRANYSNEKMTNSPRRGQPEPQRSGSRGNPAVGPENGHQTRKAVSSHLAQDSPARSSSRDGRNTTTMPIRSVHSTPSKPTQEATDNLTKAIAATDDVNGRSRSQVTSQDTDAAPPPVIATGDHEERRGGRSRHDHSNRNHKGNTKFGDFILGNTIGEGEFGKVKLGWKQDSSVQVAIKLIKRDSVGTNPSRFAKIYREVAILRGVSHPNIVRLIDKVETDRHIGIILEYASGGELFDYILNHRYLKDHSARRLFAQLISGVGYLHKKGIVHRDLKLENLLLDRNRNIIITDFGFANTFDPNEDLTDEEELNLTDRDFVKRMHLDRIKPNGSRKGDLMQTSCGSPCYAAPELVVSDSLYTGRKVDVWSCGVILYAMLAGYLPFDDDPANPEGDNINLLYKYIVTTPLTFPEYVTPHARDLLRRILVPNPRKRADLFEVARHSWLSEYAQLVEFITSSTTLPSDVQNSSAAPADYAEAPMVARSASVREAAKQKQAHPPIVGGLAKTHGNIDPEAETNHRTPKDAKRRTVQVEYVAPTTQTQRGAEGTTSKPRARSNSQGPVDAPKTLATEKPLPRDPPVAKDITPKSTAPKRPPSAHNTPPSRPTRETRATTDGPYVASVNTATRPQTGGSMQSSASMALQSRANYGQPAPPAVADTNAQGRIQQPSSADDDENMGKTFGTVPPKVAKMTFQGETKREGRGHKRSNTLGDLGSKIMGRSGSIFGGRGKKRSEQQPDKSRKYPPVSMSNTMLPGEEAGPRPSVDSRASRRSFSLGLGKKRSGSIPRSQGSGEKPAPRRFSLAKAIGLSRDTGSAPASEVDSQQDLPIQNPRNDAPAGYSAHEEPRQSEPYFDAVSDLHHPQDRANSSPVYHQRYGSVQMDNRRPTAIPAYVQGAHLNSGSESSVDMRRPPTEPQSRMYQADYSGSEGYDGRPVGSSRGNRGGVLHKNKRFTDAYDQDEYRGHEGSSGAAKRVMDFFRRRGKARGGEDR
ncbi:hypothetical protein QQZ08_003315 [Neonectria magnoliae]|uniref:Protein kinase domain-containing protein n=1 Tax=Neonectria magnoliae TaxID=2732573 RepID=A0ABR1IAT9_9HYPO